VALAGAARFGALKVKRMIAAATPASKLVEE